MTRFIPFAATMLAATQVSAGVRIETVSRDIQTHVVAEGSGQVFLLQDGKIRWTLGKSSSSTIISGTTLYAFDDAKKAYEIMDDASIKKAAAQRAAMMKEMQERAIKMPPETRTLLEQRLAAQMPQFEWQDTGKNETVEGRECHVWNLLRNGTVAEESCVVPYASLPGNEDFAKANKDLWNAFVAVAPGLIGVVEYAKARQSIDGYPVRTRSFGSDGKLLATEDVVTKLDEEPFPTSTFEVPAGYKNESPQAPGR